jgi:hypothetical protein
MCRTKTGIKIFEKNKIEKNLEMRVNPRLNLELTCETKTGIGNFGGKKKQTGKELELWVNWRLTDS